MKLKFYDWLTRYVDKDTPIGDFAQDAKRDRTFDKNVSTLEDLNNHLHAVRACQGAFDAGRDAWRRYQAYLRRP